MYLADFGLTKHAQSRSGLTHTGQFVGTVDYVAPEQIEGSEPDARSDVYSLGCVLFEMLTGAPPFADQQGGMAKMWAQVNAEPPSVRDRQPGVSEGMSAVVRHAMAKDPAARPNAAAFRGDVLAAIGEPA